MYGLDTAYLHEAERRMDEMADAANYRLAAECTEADGKISGFFKHLPSLLAALVMFFVKRWT